MNYVRSAFTGLTGLFLILLPLQFLFAGFGVFGGDYGVHEAFGAGLLHLITILMTITALIAKKWRFAGLSFALVLTIFLQIAMVSIGRDAGEPWLSAIHPFLAFLYWPYVYFLIWTPWRAEQATTAPPSEPTPDASAA
jgi:uncharacterized membrane protein YhaH (DUF805 family)